MARFECDVTDEEDFVRRTGVVLSSVIFVVGADSKSCSKRTASSTFFRLVGDDGGPSLGALLSKSENDLRGIIGLLLPCCLFLSIKEKDFRDCALGPSALFLSMKAKDFRGMGFVFSCVFSSGVVAATMDRTEREDNDCESFVLVLRAEVSMGADFCMPEIGLALFKLPVEFPKL